MDDPRSALLDELYADGSAYDARQSDRLMRRRNLEPDAAELLTLAVRMTGARHIVEIGTSNGYSTIWLADAAADTGGTVVSVDTASPDEAAENLRRAGLAGRVDLIKGDGGRHLADKAWCTDPCPKFRV